MPGPGRQTCWLRWAWRTCPSGWPEAVLAPGEPAGAVTPAGAAATGLPPGLPVFQGLMDSFAAALACDVFQPGRAAVSLGSSSSYMALTPEPVSDPRLLGPIRDALGPGTTLMQGGQTCAASLVRWFCTELGGGRDPAALDAAAAAVPAGQRRDHRAGHLAGQPHPVP